MTELTARFTSQLEMPQITSSSHSELCMDFDLTKVLKAGRRSQSIQPATDVKATIRICIPKMLTATDKIH